MLKLRDVIYGQPTKANTRVQYCRPHDNVTSASGARLPRQRRKRVCYSVNPS